MTWTEGSPGGRGPETSGPENHLPSSPTETLTHVPVPVHPACGLPAGYSGGRTAQQVPSRLFDRPVRAPHGNTGEAKVGRNFSCGNGGSAGNLHCRMVGCAALFLPFPVTPPGHPGFRPFWSFTSAWPRAAWPSMPGRWKTPCAGERRRGPALRLHDRGTGYGTDVYGIARAAIESAENLTDGVFSTLFWASAGCLAGGASKRLRRAGASCFQHPDAMWGKNDRYKHFGTFAAYG